MGEEREVRVLDKLQLFFLPCFVSSRNFKVYRFYAMFLTRLSPMDSSILSI